MRFMASLLFPLFAVAVLAQGSYSTQFQNTQNPLNEGGAWNCAQGPWFPVASSPGFAYGTQNGQVNYTDSTCALTGLWNANQSAQITIKIKGTNTAQFEEAEVRLNTTVSNGSITGYEINCSVVPGDPYLQIVRWNGALGSFTLLDSRAIGCVNGDVLKAARSGSTITAYKNGQAQFSVTDATYTSGSPGIGFYIWTVQSGTAAQANAEFGASSFTATGGSIGGGGTTSYSVSLNWVNPGGSDPPVSYNVYRSTMPTTGYSKVNPSPVTTPAYFDANLANGVYYYQVTSVDSKSKESPPSNTATFVIPGGIVASSPSSPLDLNGSVQPN